MYTLCHTDVHTVHRRPLRSVRGPSRARKPTRCTPADAEWTIRALCDKPCKSGTLRHPAPEPKLNDTHLFNSVHRPPRGAWLGSAPGPRLGAGMCMCSSFYVHSHPSASTWGQEVLGLERCGVCCRRGAHELLDIDARLDVPAPPYKLFAFHGMIVSVALYTSLPPEDPGGHCHVFCRSINES